MSRQPSKTKDKHRKSKQNKYHSTKVQQQSVDYNPDLRSKSDSSDKKPAKKKPKHGSTKPKQLASDVNVNAVPDPAPDTGITHTYTQTPVHTGVLPAVPSTTMGFSPLPPLASFATTGTALTIPYPSTSPTSTFYTPQTEPTSTASGDAAQLLPPHVSSSKPLPVVKIVCFAVGGVFILVAIMAAIWTYTRPRKRTHPIPSLPILQDDYVEQKEDVDEESLFGGKERTSARPGSNGILWNWTQYPHVSMSSKITTKNDMSAKRASTATVLGDKTGYPFDGHGTGAQHKPSPQPAPSQALQQQLQAALTKAANRVSAMSVSIYPSSPQTNAGYTDIGIAIDGPQPNHGSNLQRNDSKSRKRQSVATSAYFEDYPESSGKAYGSTLAVPKPTVGGGRMPVKGPYAPTASMRSSATLSRVPSASRRSVANPFESSQYVLPSQSPIIKSEARRERDTQALTSALGLGSPSSPPSPQTTIHPDDSITLAGDRRRSRNLGHARQRSSVMSPTMEASARLGNLMLTEFQSMTSLPSTRAMPQAGGTTSKPRAPLVKKKTDDKPPRVPSPPPLPSLAQMALSHTNPDAYADYRSPTYSIYGLYEADRKSRTHGDGNY
ncbi:hypothetical protein EUX98_g206 [Antrodiella citrinella]|uniref:Transmembrane protein n=1 Tax=Antrodiella citrinella TaxID=2447956 RepID=A0A4S4N6T8_9APHY|nr:hypothetical protein EUX98_g206 [Antrodiella citrinella]